MPTPEWVDWLSRLSPAAMLALITWAGLKGWWIWRWTHREIVDIKNQENLELRKDRDWWRDVAVRATRIGEEAVRQTSGPPS